MAHQVVHLRVRRPAAEVFDFIGTNVYRNHPRWEKEVLEIRPLNEGPIGVGSRAVMVRKDMGKVRETTYEVTAFEPGRRLAVRHLTGPMRFALEFLVEPSAADTAEVTVTVDATPLGAMRVLTPVFGLITARNTRRISADMVRVVEAAGATGAMAS